MQCVFRVSLPQNIRQKADLQQVRLDKNESEVPIDAPKQQFPFDSCEDLIQYDGKMNDVMRGELYDQLSRQVDKTDMKKTIRRFLHFIARSSVWTSFNVLGTKGKDGLRVLKMYNVMCDVLRRRFKMPCSESQKHFVDVLKRMPALVANTSKKSEALISGAAGKDSTATKRKTTVIPDNDSVKKQRRCVIDSDSE